MGRSLSLPLRTVLLCLSLAPLVACNGFILPVELAREMTDGGSGNGGGGGTNPEPPLVLPPPIEPQDPGTADVHFAIRSDRNVHGISPLVYGINDATDLTHNRPGLVRLGGNRWTAWNWETNASNAGSDYLFQNDGLLSSSNTPGAAVSGVYDSARQIGAQLLVTIPIVDYVAADKNGGGDVRNSGSGYLATRFRQNRPLKGSALSGTPNAGDGYVNQDEFVAWMKTRATSGGVVFSLDNEPDLWSVTHAEVHPNAVGYDELVTRNIQYATAVKNQWAEAKVTGLVSYGWGGYVNLQDAPDRNGKGEFIDYFLSHVRDAETQAGHRLIDHLDLHWYPEATGGGTRITTDTSPANVVTARVQAPRSLWDGTYVETSWIEDTVNDEPIELIPRMKAKIAANDPGVTLAFTEWNYGGGGHISGAVATADVLGIFGREQVAIGSFWPLHDDESFSYAAFKVFRNFDGAGAAFGDTSIDAQSDSVATATVYASLDAGNPSRVVIVAINKATTSKTAGISVAHPTVFTTGHVYSVTSASATPVASASVSAVGTNAFRVTLPAMSVTILALVP